MSIVEKLTDNKFVVPFSTHYIVLMLLNILSEVQLELKETILVCNKC